MLELKQYQHIADQFQDMDTDLHSQALLADRI